MLKINKCVDLAVRHVPKIPGVRLLGESCSKKVPPRYECKQPPANDFEREVEEIWERNKPNVFVQHCHKDPKIYKNLFFFVALPSILCLYINIFYLTDEEFKRPKFIVLDYLRIRKKPFPWHPTRTLFHNPERNALPDGYEVEVPEEQEYDPFKLKSKPIE